MRSESALHERVRRAADVTVPPADLTWVERRARTIRRRRTGVALVVGAVVAAGVALPLSGLHDIGGGGGRGNGSTGETVRPIGFDLAPGWRLAITDPSDQPGAQVVYVTDGPFAPSDLEGSSEVDGVVVLGSGAERTLRTLPEARILIVASVVYRSNNPLPPHPDFPDRPLPWDLPTGPPETSWEGASGGLSRYVLGGTTGGRFVVVDVYFGSEDPNANAVARAQEELDRLVVDPAPPPIDELDEFGLAIDPPSGWDGRLYAWASSPPILELSTISLGGHVPGNPAIPDRGSLEGAADVSVLLAESDVLDTGYAALSPPVAIGEADRCDGCEVLDDGSTPPSSHALFHRAFEEGGRSFDLYVEFGAVPRPSDLERVNDVLAGLLIDPAPGVDVAEVEPFEAPTGWFQDANPLPALIDPRIVAAAGSWRFPQHPLIACGPQPALEAMPSDAAFVWIYRYQIDPGEPLGGFRDADPWPDRFRLDLPSSPADKECAAGTDGSVRQYLFVGPTGRAYQVLVALGVNVDDATRREVEQVLSSFSP